LSTWFPSVLRVLVGDNEDVAAGRVLVELDPADYRARLDQALAAGAQADAQMAQARAQQAVFAAQLEQARANRDVARAKADDAAKDLRRYRGLSGANAGAVSRQQLDTSQTGSVTANAQTRAAEKSVAAAAAEIGYAQSLIQAAAAATKIAAAQTEQARLTLSYTEVKASVAGRIAEKTVAEGNVVQAGTALMAVVPREVYITANFKETQLDHLRRGQPVEVRIDAYPEVRLTGRVDSVQPATGAAFSVLPAENATGNWVKVVQRVPVKIVLDRLLDDPSVRPGPGMSVEVKVTVR